MKHHERKTHERDCAGYCRACTEKQERERETLRDWFARMVSEARTLAHLAHELNGSCGEFVRACDRARAS